MTRANYQISFNLVYHAMFVSMYISCRRAGCLEKALVFVWCIEPIFFLAKC